MTKNSYSIVGYGNHAKLKIIPGLVKEKKIISSIISKKNNSPYKIYKNINDATSKLDNTNNFVICSPPHIHAKQAIKILKSGFNVFIEKPIFTKVRDLKNVIKIANKNKLFFVEIMMFQYSKSFKNFLKLFNNKKKDIKKFELTFVIPNYGNKTFRSRNQKYSVNLFDLGCYPIFLVNSLFKNINLKIFDIKNFRSKTKEIIYIKNTNYKTVDISIKVGVGLKYKNEINLRFNQDKTYNFHPFFYGREGIRYLKINEKTQKKTIKFNEKNSFSNLFNVKDKDWKITQSARNKLMLKNLSSLEKLNNQYNKTSKY